MEKIIHILIIVFIPLCSFAQSKYFEGEVIYTVKIEQRTDHPDENFRVESETDNKLYRLQFKYPYVLISLFKVAEVGDQVKKGWHNVKLFDIKNNRVFNVEQSSKFLEQVKEIKGLDFLRKDYQVEKLNVSPETIQGYICQKYKVSRTTENGKKQVQYVWASPQQPYFVSFPLQNPNPDMLPMFAEEIKGFPVKINVPLDMRTFIKVFVPEEPWLYLGYVLTLKEVRYKKLPESLFKFSGLDN